MNSAKSPDSSRVKQELDDEVVDASPSPVKSDGASSFLVADKIIKGEAQNLQHVASNSTANFDKDTFTVTESKQENTNRLQKEAWDQSERILHSVQLSEYKNTFQNSMMEKNTVH